MAINRNNKFRPLVTIFGIYTTFLQNKNNGLQQLQAPSPAGQIRRERIWSHGERPQGSGQDSPETLGWGEENQIRKMPF
jgi:hypothetical protein